MAARGVVLSAMYGGSSMDMAPPPPPTYQNPSTLEALLPTVVNTEQANRLFDLMPGLEFCSYDQPTGLLLLVTISLEFSLYNASYTSSKLSVRARSRY